MKINGTLTVSSEELAEFVAFAEILPVAPHTLWINVDTGALHTTRTVADESPPTGCARLMTGPDPDWVNQWGGDWQRACDEQLNPLLAQAFSTEGGT
ncbi:hypothetical protein EEB13_05605 [Rhodococcus sp. WS3]|uniref:hypothetical protein n=1 Tax=Rhodococcus sp. WS3 TaxID=2486271 RepID=UPI00114145FA|nr:hypothetical protein [Rhodococcus sp. WS3]ROZ49398.1 hypothetical protein EEB13_05605 [Rhodococcus sp. WS3]